MNVLSLFDGMSCGQLALERAGIKYDKYLASEVDKYAIQITQKNYPNTIQLGDVREVKASDLPKIDLLIGGSPCTGFSFAGKQLNFEDPQSKLFFEYVRLMRECKPKYFLLENVKMKKEYQDVISEAMGVQPIEINSALVSAQNRKRLYWTNILGVSQPEDKGILLEDILLGVGKKIGRIVGRRINPITSMRDDYNKDLIPKQRLELREDSKSGTITTVLKDNVVIMSDKFVDRFKKYGIDFLTGKEKKAKCLCAREYEKKGKQGNYLIFNYSSSGRGNGVIEDRFYDSSSRKAHTLTKTGYNKRSFTGVVEDLAHTNKALDYMNKSVKGGRTHWDFDYAHSLDKTKSRCLTANIHRGVPYNVLVDSKPKSGEVVNRPKTFRKLHPIECERLQTVPDNYTEGVSNSQRYKMLGNGWTVDVIAHILENINKPKQSWMYL